MGMAVGMGMSLVVAVGMGVAVAVALGVAVAVAMVLAMAVAVGLAGLGRKGPVHSGPVQNSALCCWSGLRRTKL
jgi:hypothetical protein